MGCNKNKSCNKSNNNKKCCHCHCHCNCNNSMKEWRKFPNCPKKKDRTDVYMYLGEYLYDLLEEVDLPCGHDSLEDSIRILAEGGHLPCGHPSLEEIILMTLLGKKHCCC
jgi:hypothetical protein